LEHRSIDRDAVGPPREPRARFPSLTVQASLTRPPV